MRKTMLASAVAALILPAIGADASAFPGAITFPHTVRLACSVDSYSVERGTNFILVRNPSGYVIPQGTTVVLHIFVRRPSLHIGFRTIIRTETTYAQIAAGGTGTQTFTQPDGARRCTATATIRVQHPHGRS